MRYYADTNDKTHPPQADRLDPPQADIDPDVHPTTDQLALRLIARHYTTIANRYTPYHSAHEGYAVILEELDGLKAEVWANAINPDHRNQRLLAHAIDIAVAALRFAVDICAPSLERHP